MEKYKHAEAFMHMNYVSKDGSHIIIWNSRDGVTPFIIMLEGKEYQHTDWKQDKRDVDYKPKPGDYIFRTVTREDLLEELPKYIEKLKVEAQDHDWIRENILARPQEWIEDEIKEQLEMGEPRLVKLEVVI